MKQMVFKRFERFWHWSQALLIIMMMVTGFEIHGTFKLFGFYKAVLYHEYLAYTLMTLWVFAIFWHFTTGEWKQYTPTMHQLPEVLKYYAWGIFKGENHPYKATPERKHNPMQRFAYLGFHLVMGPLVWITGLLKLLYSDWEALGLGWMELTWVAYFHLVGAYLLIVFLIAHVYMATTGATPLAYIKAMITGYDEHH